MQTTLEHLVHTVLYAVFMVCVMLLFTLFVIGLYTVMIVWNICEWLYKMWCDFYARFLEPPLG